MLTKLKAIYTLVEQLYTGSQRALAVVALSNEVPNHLTDVLRRLAVLPQRFQELTSFCKSRSYSRSEPGQGVSTGARPGRHRSWIPQLEGRWHPL